MKSKGKFVLAAGLFGAGIAGMGTSGARARAEDTDVGAVVSSTAPIASGTAAVVSARPVDPWMSKGLVWLIEAQQDDGGWGAGTHAAQHVRDPHAVKSDPGTTAFVGMALIRMGNTPTSGTYKDAVSRATEFLVKVVETAPEDGPRITDLRGTQPQVKLGENVDTSLCAQFLTRVLPQVASDAALEKRVATALDKCIHKIEKSQKADGSWNHGGWAPVLQSSMANQALEGAQSAGRSVDKGVLEKSRGYQRGNRDEKTGRASAGVGAGVELYAGSANQRANAQEAASAQQFLDKAKADGKLAKDAPMSEENLRKAGLGAGEAKAQSAAFAQTVAANKRLEDDQMLAGFGNNGGEEFLSYMLTSEALVVTGGEPWTKWTDKMHERLAKIQNPDGSWSGHHCITSPVFCTAGVLLCLTADRDAQLQPTIVAKK